MEGLLDSVRYFAEGCDHLTSIDVFSDFDYAFGGLTSSVLKELRDSMGSSVSIPVWGWVNSQGDARRERNRDTIRGRLAELSLPLTYSTISEHCDALIPIHPNIQTTYESSLQIARTIDAVSPSDASMSSRDWIYRATTARRYPVLMLESLVIKDPSINQLQQTVINSFDHNKDVFTNEERRQHVYKSNSSSRPISLWTVNPFAESLSAVLIGDWAIDTTREHQYDKPFSNMLGVTLQSQEQIPGGTIQASIINYINNITIE